MSGTPYLLAVASHKGGTGRTTTALTLAWSMGQAGQRVVFVDADPLHSASLIARAGSHACGWKNVECVNGLEAIHRNYDCDVVVVDSPSLTDPLSRTVLARVDGIVLTCLADPLSIRTVPAAAAVIESIRSRNPKLELLGISIILYNENDLIQKAMLGRLQESHRDLLLEPAVPLQSEIRNWPLKPGSEPPAGAARDAIVRLKATLERWMRAA